MGHDGVEGDLLKFVEIIKFLTPNYIILTIILSLSL